MKLIALQEVYRKLMESTEQATFLPPADEWSVELVLAHVIATTRTLCIVGIEILDGREASYEGGTLSTTPYWLASIVESSENMDGLRTTLRQSSAELLALARRFDENAVQKRFPATIYDGHGKVLFNDLISFGDLLNNLLVPHLSAHFEQIQALRDNQAK